MDGDVKHPARGHTVIPADSARRYIESLRETNNVGLIEHARTMRHVAGLHDPPWVAEQWEYERCLEELERRKLSSRVSGSGGPVSSHMDELNAQFCSAAFEQLHLIASCTRPRRMVTSSVIAATAPF